ncbi:MAG: fasciclin domain-containing protein [bacterium]
MKSRLLGMALFFLVFSTVAHSVELIDFMRQTGNLSHLRMLFETARWGEAGVGGASVQDVLLKRINKYTIFAPTDYAFNVFGKVGFLQVKGREVLFSKFVQTHIVEGKIKRDDMKPRTRPYKTVAGNTYIYVDYKQKGFYVYARRDAPADERAQILYSVETDNGIVHVIDKVLIFEQLKSNLDAITQMRLR